MDYRTKFMMNEGCLILAYAYAVSGYVSAAAAMGFFSAFLAVLWHSENRFFSNLRRISAITLVQIPFILVSFFPGMGHAIALLAFCNAVVSCLWMESSGRAVRPAMRILSAVFPAALFLAMAVPEEVLTFLSGSEMPRLSMVELVLFIYLPVFLQYAWRKTSVKRIFVNLEEIL